MSQAALLLLPDGGVKLFTERTRVSDIMKEHPGFAVGSFTSARENLPAEKLLRSGSSYFLHRVTNSMGGSDPGNSDDGAFSGFPRTRSSASAPSIRGEPLSPEHSSPDLRQTSPSQSGSDNFRGFTGSLNLVKSSTMIPRRASLAIDTSTREVLAAFAHHHHQQQPRQVKQELQTVAHIPRNPQSAGIPRSPRAVRSTTPSLSPCSSITPSPRQLSPRETANDLLSPRYQDFAAWSTSTTSSCAADLTRVQSETSFRPDTNFDHNPYREAGKAGKSATTGVTGVNKSGVQGRILKWKIQDDATSDAREGRRLSCAVDLTATRLPMAGSYGKSSARASISGVRPLYVSGGF
ncbi:hypothetical protein CLOM_g20786 [Closterium sp. NIES-68]|nr:hypothetical protein CLOM_g20786 [Closterium sp. NIES-68]GJP83511.1 hypothetical protein CLOP_g13655 [Closterium sp. NIES-67]